MTDFAFLLYKEKWYETTRLMSAESKGWFIDLICHQSDKGIIPKDIDDLAVICRVKFKDFEKFKSALSVEVLLNFVECDEGYVNEFYQDKFSKRKEYKSIKSEAGKMSSIAKKARKLCDDENWVKYAKDNFDYQQNSTKDTTQTQQILQHMLQLYRNRISNRNSNGISNSFERGTGENFSQVPEPDLDPFQNQNSVSIPENEKLDPIIFDLSKEIYSIDQVIGNEIKIQQDQNLLAENENLNAVSDVINFLNQITGSSYIPNGNNSRNLLELLRGKYSVQDLMDVILWKWKEWGNDPERVSWVRPQTLFGENFESYYQTVQMIKNNPKIIENGKSKRKRSSQAGGTDHLRPDILQREIEKAAKELGQ